MKRPLKILGILGAVLLVLVIALVVLAKVLITPERVRSVVVPRAEAALNRQVSLGAISVSLFSGITLEQLVIQEKAGEESFVAAERAVLRYQLWPLLFRRVIIDEVRLIAPRIRVERFADGTFNFSDLQQTAEPEAAVPSEEAEGEAGAPIDLLVSQIAITGGELLFIDHQSGREDPLTYQLTDLQVSASDISLQQEFPFTVSGRLGEGTIGVDGQVNPQTMQAAVNATVANLDLALFTPYFPAELPVKVNNLKLGLKVSAEGGKELLRSRGEITLQPIDLQLTREGEKPLSIRDASLTTNYDLAVDLVQNLLTITRMTIAYNGIPLEISGTVADFADAARVELQAVLPPLDLKQALAALPAELVGDLAPLQPSGEVSARLTLAGLVEEPKSLLQQGEVQLAPIEVTAGGGRPSLRGTLRLTGDSLRSENLQLSMGENQAAIQLQADNLLGDIIRVSSAVQADRFALDPLLQTAAAPAATTPSKPAPAKAAEPLDLPLVADGTVRIGQTVYQGLTIDDFDLAYHLEKNVLTVQRLQGKVANGTFGSTASIDLGRAVPTYTSRFDLKGIQADPLVSAFWPKSAGTVFGTLNLQATVEGRGTDPAVLKQNLNSRGDLVLSDGRFTGGELVQGLATFLKIEELRNLQFDQAKGNFTIRQGQLLVDSSMTGKEVSLRPQGTVALEGNRLDLALNLRVGPSISKRLDREFTQLLADPQGWTQVPVKIAGTVDAPRFSLDTAALGEQVKEKAGEEIRQRLQKEIDRRFPTGTSEPAAPGEEPPAEKPGLEEKLRGLFGN